MFDAALHLLPGCGGTFSRTFSDFFMCYSYTFDKNTPVTHTFRKCSLYNAPKNENTNVLRCHLSISRSGVVINPGPWARICLKATRPDIISQGLGGHSELLHLFRVCATKQLLLAHRPLETSKLVPSSLH